jgi:hypothetical protein
MIPLCSRFDSVLFTPKMPAIACHGNYSRSPKGIKACSIQLIYFGVRKIETEEIGTIMATNEPIQSHRKVTVGTERNFGIVFAVFFAIIGFAPLYHGGAVRWWAIALGATFLFCAFVAPRLLRPLNLLWFKFGLLLHHIVNPIIMGGLYFGAVVPMGLLVRALRKDLLHLKFDKTTPSYWIPRNPPAPPPGGMTKQF